MDNFKDLVLFVSLPRSFKSFRESFLSVLVRKETIISTQLRSVIINPSSIMIPLIILSAN